MYQVRQRTQESIPGGAWRSARVGQRGEQTAAAYLEGRGYRVLARNWRSGDPAQRGELDLILRHRSVLVVCEVKTRTGGRLAHPAEAVTAEKLGRLRRLAGLWLREQAHTAPRRGPGRVPGLGLLLPARRPRPFFPAELRIDVVAVRLGPREPFPVLAIDHLAGVA
jgi:putative endonuclease